MNENFSKNHRSPTIIVDLKELCKTLGDKAKRWQSFEVALSNGGRFQKFNEILDYFFGEMKRSGADLVFIARIQEGRYIDIRLYKSLSLRPTERIWYNMLHSICSKYGRVITTYGLDKRSILSYARENRDIMALITRKTEFLVHKGDFKIWSLTKVKFRHLKIYE